MAEYGNMNKKPACLYEGFLKERQTTVRNSPIMRFIITDKLN